MVVFQDQIQHARVLLWDGERGLSVVRYTSERSILSNPEAVLPIAKLATLAKLCAICAQLLALSLLLSR